MSGAVEAAEEAGKEIKNVAVGAFEGVQKGIASAVESVGDKMKQALIDHHIKFVNKTGTAHDAVEVFIQH